MIIAVAIENSACYLSPFRKLTAMPMTATAELTIENLPIKNAALVYRAINHPLRHQILRLLHHNKRMIVTKIYSTLGWNSRSFHYIWLYLEKRIW